MGQLAVGLRDSMVSWPLRSYMLRNRARAELSLISGDSAQLGFRPITHIAEDLAGKFLSSRDYFILGSGASVLDLGSHEWQTIRQGVTIGFGPWALHNFVPDIFAFSPARGLADYRRVFSEVMARPDIVRHKPQILLLRPKDPFDVAEYRTLPTPHHRRAFLYGRVNTIGRSSAELVREISRWHGSKIGARYGVALDSGATLARLISIGISFGARRIVLVGVDLNTPDYFFQADRSFLISNGFTTFDTGQTGSSHDTLFRTNRPVGILEMISAYRSVSESLGTRIELMSDRSALSSILPAYSGGVDA